MNNVPGMVLNELRREKKLSQLEVADALGVSQSMVSRYERYELPREYVIDLSVALNVTPDWIQDRVTSFQVEDDEIANNALKLLKQGIERNDVVRRVSQYVGASRQRVLSAMATVPVEELNQISGNETPGGFVDSTPDLLRWEHKLKTAVLEPESFFLLLRMTTLLDKISWVVVGTTDEFKRLVPRLGEHELKQLGKTSFVQRVGNVEWVFRLKFPEEN